MSNLLIEFVGQEIVWIKTIYSTLQIFGAVVKPGTEKNSPSGLPGVV
jgi:hypothetical protein